MVKTRRAAKDLSESRQQQLADARARAVYSRRVKQKERLEKQLEEISEFIRKFDERVSSDPQDAAGDTAATPFGGTEDESEHDCSNAARILSQCRQPEGPSRAQCSGAASTLRACSSNTEADVAREVVDPVETSRRRDVATEAVRSVDDEGTASPEEDHKTLVCKLHHVCDRAMTRRALAAPGQRA